MKRQVEYQAFVLRLWRESASSEAKASVTDIHEGRVRVFATLEDLCRWLLDRYGG